MNAHGQQVQAFAKYHGSEKSTLEYTGRETKPLVTSDSDERKHEWADVLKDLERYY